MGTLLKAVPALQGFFTIGVLIGVGWVLAHVRVLTREHRHMMSFLALYVASPALMFVTMSQADLTRVFSHSMVAAYGAIIATATGYVVVSRLWFRHNLAGTTIGAMLSCYSNAGNLGIPVAAYALGDVTWMVPILLIQLVVLQRLHTGGIGNFFQFAERIELIRNRFHRFPGGVEPFFNHRTAKIVVRKLNHPAIPVNLANRQSPFVLEPASFAEGIGLLKQPTSFIIEIRRHIVNMVFERQQLAAGSLRFFSGIRSQIQRFQVE